MGHIQGELWDIDGTILDKERLLIEIHRSMVEAHSVTYDIESNIEVCGKTPEGGLAALFEFHGLKNHVDFAYEFQKRVDLLNQAHEVGLKFVPGFMEYFDALKKSLNLHRAVVSSTGSHEVRNSYTKYGFLEKFDAICLVNEKVVHGKPAPDIIIYGAGAIGVPVRECALWEDSPSGVVSGLRAGVGKLIVLTRTLPEEKMLQAVAKLDSAIAQSLKIGENTLFIDDYTGSTTDRTLSFLEHG